MNRSVYIVEDDLIVQEELSILVSQFGYQVSGAASNSSTAIEEIKKNQPELVCLDINLGHEDTGFKVADFLARTKTSGILFITAFFDEVTLSQANQYSPLAYIVKPFRDADIKTNLALALHKTIRHDNSISRQTDSLFVRESGEILSISAQDIELVQAESNYSKIIFCDGSRKVVSTTLGILSEKLEAFGFIRIHKSYLVNPKQIKNISGSTLYTGSQHIPIGRQHRANLINKITVL